MLRNSIAWMLLVPLLALLGSCASTELTNAWVDPEYSGKPMRKVLVIGEFREPATRRLFEDTMVAKLKSQGTEAVPSYPLIPDEEKDDAKLEAIVRDAVIQSQADGILMSRLARIDKENRYSPGYVGVRPGVGYYGGFYGHYTSVQSYYAPPLVHELDVYVLETNLWSVASASMIWTGSTETFNPGDTRKEIEAFSGVIAQALKSKSLL